MRKFNAAIYGFYFAAACLLVAMPSCKKTEETVQEPTPAAVTMTDIDGNVYATVKIGNQTWTTTNLKTTRYNDGVAISTGLDNVTWAGWTIGACTSYDNTVENNTTYGKLYNWNAMKNGKLAPKGWHIPTRAEWTTLTTALGADAGGKMKSTSTLWAAPNTGANNSSGFGGLAGGSRRNTGDYAAKTTVAYWWATDERNSTQGYYINVDNGSATAVENIGAKSLGLSIRCIKD